MAGQDEKPEASTGPKPRQSTLVFRLLNPELFVRPRTWVTVVGTLAFVSSIAFIGWRSLEYQREEAERLEYEQAVREREERRKKKLEAHKRKKRRQDDDDGNNDS